MIWLFIYAPLIWLFIYAPLLIREVSWHHCWCHCQNIEMCWGGVVCIFIFIISVVILYIIFSLIMQLNTEPYWITCFSFILHPKMSYLCEISFHKTQQPWHRLTSRYCHSRVQKLWQLSKLVIDSKKHHNPLEMALT